RGAVRGVRHLGAQGGPEAVDAADVGDAGLVGGDQGREEGAGAVVDAAPAHVEGALPLVGRVGDEAAAAGDARVVEQQVDVGGLVPGEGLVAEARHLGG